MQDQSGKKNTPKTILRFLYPCIAIGLGIMYLIPGDNIYNSAPQLYRYIRHVPENFWGTVWLIAGLISLFGTCKRVFLATALGYLVHTILLIVYAYEMSRTSHLSVFWFGTLGFFQAARLIEICNEKGREVKGG